MRLCGRGLRVPIGPAGSRQGCDPADLKRRRAGVWAFSPPIAGKFGERVRLSPCFFLLPVGAVEGAVLDGLRNMAGLDLLAPLEIRNGSRHLQDAVVSSS